MYIKYVGEGAGGFYKFFKKKFVAKITFSLPYCKLKVISRSECRLNIMFRFEDSLEKIHSGLFTAIRVVTAKLLIMEKTSATFIPQRGSKIVQENT